MNKAAEKPTTTSANGNKAIGLTSVSLMLLDTSARLFIPSVGGTVLGVWADVSWDTKPWFTLIGVIAGTILAFLMVYSQLKSLKKIDQKEDK